MNSRVILSPYSIAVTLIVIGVLLAGCVVTFGNYPSFFFMLGALVLLVVAALICSPVSISADDENIVVRSPLKRHRIPMRMIGKVELFQPTMAAFHTMRFRIFGSGGFFGYWGVFFEGDIGRYAAYYGKASDCFLLTMKNGDKYVLGCHDPSSAVDFISSRIK